jgi:hypothetical protein
LGEQRFSDLPSVYERLRDKRQTGGREMKLTLDKPYNGLAKGDEMEVNAGVASQLIKRGIAHEKKDPDNDGKAEGGIAGEKKAFTSPPQQQTWGKHKRR